MKDVFFGDEDTSLIDGDATEVVFGDKIEEVPYESAPSSAPENIPVDEDAVSEDESSSENEEGMTQAEIIKEILSWVRMIAIGVIVGVFLVLFVVQRDNVYGDSMYPTLEDGEVIFTEKVSTYFNNYHRGDIVILDGHDMDGYDREEYLIKRIIGLPGETIRIADGCVYIKPADSTEFFKLEEPYLDASVITSVMPRSEMLGYNEITLGPDEYYCMGDNRIVSNDSRNLGPFSEDRIKGIAFIAVFPFEMFGLL